MNTNLIFEANEAEVCVDICIENDSVAEQTESFVVSLERTPDLHRRIILHPTEGTIVINDDDGEPTISHSPVWYVQVYIVYNDISESNVYFEH